jgi:hypothetical protein
MIGITISARAYAAIAATLSASSAIELEIAPDGEYRVWLSQIAVECLLALHEPGETFSDVILRLTRRGSLATATKKKPRASRAPTRGRLGRAWAGGRK